VTGHASTRLRQSKQKGLPVNWQAFLPLDQALSGGCEPP
jgi:hypothetical protein